MRNLLHHLPHVREAVAAYLPWVVMVAAIGSFLLQLIGLLLQMRGR